MKRLLAFVSLFTSIGTLMCCAVPALFVALGFGAAFAGLIANVPQLIWLSENKIWLFLVGGILLVAGGILQWRAKSEICPADPITGEACATTRDWSKITYFVALAMYGVG